MISQKDMLGIICTEAFEMGEKILSVPKQNKGQSKQDYETPDCFMTAISRVFGKPQVDLAASNNNTKCTIFLTEGADSLIKNWAEDFILKQYKPLLCWLNPPFANIKPWAKKCAEESEKGAKILMLVPASVGSNWFKNYVYEIAHVLFLSPRMKFVGCKNPYPKDLMLVAYGFSNFDGFKFIEPHPRSTEQKKFFYCWRWDKTFCRTVRLRQIASFNNPVNLLEKELKRHWRAVDAVSFKAAKKYCDEVVCSSCGNADCSC